MYQFTIKSSQNNISTRIELQIRICIHRNIIFQLEFVTNLTNSMTKWIYKLIDYYFHFLQVAIKQFRVNKWKEQEYILLGSYLRPTGVWFWHNKSIYTILKLDKCRLIKLLMNRIILIVVHNILDFYKNVDKYSNS